MKKIIFPIIFLIVTSFSGFAQGTGQLKEVSRPPLAKIKIIKAEVVSETSERLIVSVEYSTRSMNGKTYTISGVGLDNKRIKMVDVQAQSEELAEGNGVTDLVFKFKNISNTKYSKPRINTDFIEIRFMKKSEGGLGSMLEEFGGSDKNKDNKLDELNEEMAEKYIYEYKKDWRVGRGIEEVKVTLKPIGKANALSKKSSYKTKKRN